MTSTEIERLSPSDVSTNGWLKIVALQLALFQEALYTAAAAEQPRRGPGRPKGSKSWPS